LTTLAFDFVRASFLNSHSRAGAASAAHMDEVSAAVLAAHSGMSIEDQLLSARRQPRALMEEMLYRGLTQGIVDKDGTTVNTLKIAQLFMSTRCVKAMLMLRRSPCCEGCR
jgi:hypothetical protein